MDSTFVFRFPDAFIGASRNLGLPLAGIANQQVTGTDMDSMQVRGGGFSIPRHTIDGGGTISATGGNWNLAGTTG